MCVFPSLSLSLYVFKLVAMSIDSHVIARVQKHANSLKSNYAALYISLYLSLALYLHKLRLLLQKLYLCVLMRLALLNGFL